MDSNVTRYEIYRGVKPYFAPAGTDSIKLEDIAAPGAALQVSHSDPGPFTASLVYCYEEVAIGANGLSSPTSAPKGAFPVELVPCQ